MNRLHMRLAAPLAAALALLAPAAAQAQRTTQIVSPPSGGGVANGASDNIAFSQDNRVGRYMAYDSEASNLVGGDTNGVRDIFVVKRNAAEGVLTGSLSRVSVNSSRRQANGASTNPSIDGQTGRRPTCVVYESKATNLDRADRSRDSDVFLYNIPRRRTTLVSAGRGNARNGVVDGECEFVTFESGGYVWVRDLEARETLRIGRGGNPDQLTNGKGVAYEYRGQIYFQAFQKTFRRGLVRMGARKLVSATRTGAAGNGPSRNPSADDNGYYVAFESTATNLCLNTCTMLNGGVDENGTVSDVFRRNINPSRAPTKDHMQMVSYSYAVAAQGDGASRRPAMTGAGENILFESDASNLRENTSIRTDSNGVSDIYYWNYPRVRQQGNVSLESRTDDRSQFNGPSGNPGTSNRANYVGWTSTAQGQAGELNGPGVPDVFARFLGGE